MTTNIATSDKVASVSTKRIPQQLRSAARDVPLALSLRTYTPKEIIETVCTAYGVDVRQVHTGNVHKRVAWARHVSVYIVRKALYLSYPDIGKILNRDHSTMIASVQRVEKCLAACELSSVLHEDANFVRGLIVGFAATDCYRLGYASIVELPLILASGVQDR